MRLHELQGHKVGICASGGLDSKTVTTRLRRAAVDCIAFTADLAQPDEADIEGVRAKMAPTGAEVVIVDLRAAMADACMMTLRAQATYDGGYWNTTGIARAVTVKGLLGPMQARGCDVLAHGATGRGNDQLRFERYTNTLAPDMGVYAPWRDPMLLEEFPGRREMAAYLQAQGIEAEVGPRKRYSTDANLAGLSHEAEDLEDVETPMTIVEPLMGVWPMDAPDEIEDIEVRIEQGHPVALDGERLAPFELMQQANRRAGANGIGIRHALENRIIGTKSRGVYEAPGLELLGACVRFVYQATMDRRGTQLFHSLSALVAQQVYDGRLYDPQTRAALAGIDVLAETASGTVRVGMYKGHILFKALSDCRHTLYNPADASMEASDGLNPVSSQGYVEIMSTEARQLARGGHIKPF
jgi:argininosuccinate synthase